MLAIHFPYDISRVMSSLQCDGVVVIIISEHLAYQPQREEYLNRIVSDMQEDAVESWKGDIIDGLQATRRRELRTCLSRLVQAPTSQDPSSESLCQPHAIKR